MSPLEFPRLRWEYRHEWNASPVPTKAEDLPKVRDAQWTAGDVADSRSTEPTADKIDFTWVGHAACHFQIPVPMTDGQGTRSTRRVVILTDPVLSQRCSPVQFMGPARYTRAPTTVQKMSEDVTGRAWPDIVLLSHNHYDHLDYNTLKAIVSKPNGRPQPTFLVPLGVKEWFTANLRELPEDKVVELDWWEERTVEVSAPQAESAGDNPDSSGRLRFIFTPAQHFSARSPFDRDQTLWGSWAIHTLAPTSSEPTASSASQPPLSRIWFSGDSGYRFLPRHVKTLEEEEKLPHCPAFKEIGELLGPFDLAAIACGAYSPRAMFSEIHMNPREAVQVHKQVRSRWSVGIHHSTFRLTAEDVHEPARLFLEEGTKAGLARGQVNILEIGETQAVPIGSGTS
ncbi:unnamed protein product [Parajaminaea phylloscopi]